MATTYIAEKISKPAGEDLSNDKYRVVVLDTGEVRRPNSADEEPFGILQNAPDDGEPAAIVCRGFSNVVFGGSVAENDKVTYEYNSATDAGKVVACGTALDLAMGVCVDGGAEDEIGLIKLTGIQTPVNVAS